MHNERDYLIKKLQSFKREDIIFSSHTRIRLAERQMDENEVIENIINPVRLEYALRETILSEEEKFDCYFGYSKNLCHRYVLAVNKKLTVITAIKIQRRWQRRAEKKLRSNRES